MGSEKEVESALELYKKLENSFELIAKFNKSKKEFEKISRNLEKEYGGRDAVVSLVRKIGLLSGGVKLLPTIPVQRSVPRSFLFEIKNKKYNLSDFVIFEKSYGCYTTKEKKNIKDFAIKLYNIIISRNGNLSLILLGDNNIYSFLEEEDNLPLSLNIPILLARILEDKSFEERYPEFKKFIETNDACTLNSVYNFTVNNLDKVLEIFSNLNNYIQKLKEYFSSNKVFGEYEKGIASTISLRSSQDHYLYYDFYKSVKSFVFRMQTYNPVCEFPVKIVITENKIIPYFMPKKFFKSSEYKSNISKKEIDSRLLTFEEKVSDEMNIMLDKKFNKMKNGNLITVKNKKFDLLIPSDVEAIKALYSETLKHNLSLIISAFDKIYKKNKVEKCVEIGKEQLDRLKETDAFIKETANQLQVVFTTMYSKELLLTNI